MGRGHEKKCCRLHGCLLDGNCPIEVGAVIQEGPCVLCPPVGEVGWDNGTARVLRAIADQIDNNYETGESPWVKLPHLGDIMRKMKGAVNPKLVVQLLHVLGGTCHQQSSAQLRPIEVGEDRELRLEIMIESGEVLSEGSIHLSREFWTTLTEYFDDGLAALKDK